MDLVNSLNDRLLFAVPKKGRLNEATLDLLAGSDILFHRHSRLDIALVKNLPIALIFLPAADIPTFVGEGRVDLGITGRDQVAEHEASSSRSSPSSFSSSASTAAAVTETETTEVTGVEEVMDLDFGRCRLQVQVPAKGGIERAEELVGKNIVTSFTGLTERYFRGLEGETGNADASEGKIPPLKTKIKYVGGSVEAACALGVADGIVDLVESGETMRAAGLKAISVVLESTAVLIRSRHPSNPQLVDRIASRIRGVITAQRHVLCTYNIHRTGLSHVRRITPGKRAPTITELEEPGWVAVQAMVERHRIAVTMDDLIAVGATDVLVVKIDNCRAG